MLLDVPLLAHEAIRSCRAYSEGATGHLLSLSLLTAGILISAYACYWEALFLLRIMKDWSETNSNRFHELLNYFEKRAQYGQTTFQHKYSFLKGLDVCSIY